ncbi:MAG TPA: glycosyltransferase family 4 protein [Candidatus Hydrogenedentes bacterium]|nr:glycosyltransferase family 4 protein [Candidatus Hydrogenedentota bacterium]
MTFGSNRPRVILFGNETERIAAIRYRVITFAEMLRADGYDCTVCLTSSLALWRSLYENRGPLAKALYFLLVLARRAAQLRHVIGADVVFFRGPLLPYGPPFLERLTHLLNPRMVFDIDDAVWEPPAYVDSFFERFMDHQWIWKMCAMCAHGVVGNQYLHKKVAPKQPNLTIIPTCVDMDRHTQKRYPPPDKRPVVLGWTGLHTNLGYFEAIQDTLRDLARRHDIVLSVATGKPYRLEGVRVVNHHWTLDREIEYLQEADIGLMPLVDSPRARGKCAYKAMQYMAVGTPCVISPVGMNAEVIEDGVTGFLAETPQQWLEKLEMLIKDAALRERMGRAARIRMQECYSHEANYPKFKAMIDQVAASGPGKSAVAAPQQPRDRE